jgi:hypothetical protein
MTSLRKVQHRERQRFTSPSTLLGEAALPSDHSYSTTHLSVLAPFRICASPRGEKRDTSPWDRLCKTGMVKPAIDTLVYKYIAYESGECSGEL